MESKITLTKIFHLSEVCLGIDIPRGEQRQCQGHSRKFSLQRAFNKYALFSLKNITSLQMAGDEITGLGDVKWKCS